MTAPLVTRWCGECGAEARHVQGFAEANAERECRECGEVPPAWLDTKPTGWCPGCGGPTTVSRSELDSVTELEEIIPCLVCFARPWEWLQKKPTRYCPRCGAANSLSEWEWRVRELVVLTSAKFRISCACCHSTPVLWLRKRWTA